MKINILDHGLTGRTGHHFEFCHSLARHLMGQGAEVGVFAFRGAGQDVLQAFQELSCPISPAFSQYAYAAQPSGQEWPLEAIASRTADELDAMPAADLWVFPTLTGDHLLAYSRARNPPPMVGLVHTEPNASNPAGGRAWALGCEGILTRGLAATLGAIDPVIGAFVQTYSGDLALQDLPIPADGSPRQAYPDRPRSIGFFGHQRKERGMALIPGLIHRLLALDYEIVLHDTRDQFEGNRSNPHLRIKSFVPDLGAELDQCDLVVCPMERRNYTLRVSGIVHCAVASGVPFVLPAGTLPAVREHGLGSSCVYLDHSVDGILEAIQRLASNYPAHAAAARAGAARWAEKHGLDRFARILLEKAR